MECPPVCVKRYQSAFAISGYTLRECDINPIAKMMVYVLLDLIIVI